MAQDCRVGNLLVYLRSVTAMGIVRGVQTGKPGPADQGKLFAFVMRFSALAQDLPLTLARGGFASPERKSTPADLSIATGAFGGVAKLSA